MRRECKTAKRTRPKVIQLVQRVEEVFTSPVCSLSIIMVFVFCLLASLVVHAVSSNNEDLLTNDSKISVLYEEPLIIRVPTEVLVPPETESELDSIGEDEPNEEVVVVVPTTVEPISTSGITSSSEWNTFTITAYCPCTSCCGIYGTSDPSQSHTATGTTPIQGRTISADWSTYPPGTLIEIEGYGIFIVEDRGGAIKGNKIDMYFYTHQDALQFGRRQINCRVVEK